MLPFYISLGVLGFLVMYIIVKYNAIVKLRNIRNQSFADIDVQLKLRFDLIPNLIETVKGYATHEKETLENVTKARTSFLNAGGIEDKMQADNMLTGALKSLFAVSENYPDLKANQNFLQMQTELSDIENKIAAARRFFNNATQEYNTYIQMFPSNIIAGMFNFKEEALFGVSTPEEREVVKVTF
ncbi:LemA family protein [Candidatus Gracilibacteria bacterium]|nr:LemA family protein [Candidatus Gracilibacteria bacterium]